MRTGKWRCLVDPASRLPAGALQTNRGIQIRYGTRLRVLSWARSPSVSVVRGASDVDGDNR